MPQPNYQITRLSNYQIAVALLVALSAGALAQPSDRGRAEVLTERAGRRLRALQGEAERLASEERTLLGDLRRLEIEREIKTEQLRRAADEAEGAARESGAADDQVQRLEREALAALPELRARLTELYKLGRARYIRLLLSTSEIGRIGEATRLVAALAARDAERIQSHQRRIDVLKSARATLAARAEELAGRRAEAEQARAAAERALAARNDLIRRIDAERDLNAQLTGELQAAHQKIQLTLRGLQAASADTVVLPLRPFQGDLEWPAAGPVRQRINAVSAGRRTTGGIEIAAEESSPVVAVHDGTVAFAGSFTAFGNLVILDHGAQSFSLYGYLMEPAVARGARVERGRPIGAVGVSPTGRPGLYFELRVDGRPVDPLQWLRKK